MASQESQHFSPPSPTAATPLLSYDARESNPNGPYLWHVPETWSIRWVAFEPIVSGVTVLEDGTDPNSPQQPFQNSDGTYHPIANAFTVEPPVSSVDVILYILTEYEEVWNENCFCGTKITDDMRAFGAPPPCACFGRYMAPPPVKVIGTGPRGAVNILDHISTVSPYLERCRDDIIMGLKEMAYYSEGCEPIYVNPSFGDEMQFDVVGDPSAPANSALNFFKHYAELARGAIRRQAERQASG